MLYIILKSYKILEIGVQEDISFLNKIVFITY